MLEVWTGQLVEHYELEAMWLVGVGLREGMHPLLDSGATFSGATCCFVCMREVVHCVGLL